MKRNVRTFFPILLAVMFLAVMSAYAADRSPTDEGWPRALTSKGSTGIVYEPQIDSWDGFNLKAHTAVAVRTTVKQEPVYGVITFSASTLVDKDERIVTLEGVQITDVKFPSAQEQAPKFLPILQQTVKKKVRVIALDRLEAALGVSDQLKTGGPVSVKNDPPLIVFANKPSILVYIDGDPRYVPVKETGGSLSRVLNTRVLLLKDASGKHYLHLFDGYLEAPTLDGPWTVSTKPPLDLKKAETAARESGQVDLMEGQPDAKTNAPPSLRDVVPQIYTSSQPTELIVVEGDPNFLPIAGTELLYISNTTGNVFKNLKDNKTYLLVSGRWFRAGSLAGPWEYVPHKGLPPDFAKIPDDSSKENVKASIPGTPQAREALVANSVPQTTKIRRADARFVKLEIDGEPQLAPIEGTTLFQVVNCSTPVIKVDDQTWFTVEDGAWYVASSLDGPWAIADSVPAEIYNIPASSNLHYVTYVKVYNATPEYVYTGYTPGYFGTVVTDDVVVYGTGYDYTPWIGSYWFGPPITYGLGGCIGWTPWWGWGWGFGYGWGWGWGYGWGFPPAPWWGPYWGWGHFGHHRFPWGPGGWAHTGGNIFHRGGPWAGGHRRGGGHPAFSGSRLTGKYGSAYNSRTGALLAGQRASVKNVYTNRFAADARGNVTRTRGGQTSTFGSRGQGRSGNQVFATREGRVYRPASGGNWQRVNPSAGNQRRDAQGRPRDFSRAQQGRQFGQQRYQSFQSNRPSGGFQQYRPSGSMGRGGGGFSHGGGGMGRGGGGGMGGRR